MYNTDDLRIDVINAVATPNVICEDLPITEQAAESTFKTRTALHNILPGKDDRLLVFCEPINSDEEERIHEELDESLARLGARIWLPYGLPADD